MTKTEAHKTEFEQMVEFLGLAYNSKSQIVPCLLGPVGIGKTAAVRQHAKNVGAKNVVTIIASQILPSEVSGLTMPDKETKSMEIYDHYRLSSLTDGDILFFDELLEADQSVLSACLTLIESRMMMSGKLLPDIQIIAATNPVGAASTIKPSIRQRFMFKRFTVDTLAVKDYIKKETGVEVNHALLNLVKTSINTRDIGNTYNFLTPRSLTKLAIWMKNTPEKDHEALSKIIDKMWSEQASGVGTQLYECFQASKLLSRSDYKDAKVKEIVKEVIPDLNVNDYENIEDLLEYLTTTAYWQEIVDKLNVTAIKKKPIPIMREDMTCLDE